MLSLGLDYETANELLSELITDGFVNEERFSKSFVSGKFRIKKWGRLKIERALKTKGLTDYCIQVGLSEIDEEDYQEVARSLIERKSDEISEENPLVKRVKITKFMASKGYEYDLINSILDNKR